MAERWPLTPADVYRDVGRWYPWYAKRGGRWPPGANVPLIADDAGSVAHVWNPDPGTGLVDIFGNAWTQNGAVPLVPRDGLVPAGFGPFSAANYFSLGSGSDILDFAGDFSMCAVVVPSGSGTNIYGNGGNGGGSTSGHNVLASTVNGAATLQVPGINVPLSTTGVIVAGVNVVCWGKSGGNILGKANLAALQTTAQALTPNTTFRAQLGQTVNNVPWTGSIHELWASTTTPSDALFTAIAQSIKTKLGITAW